MRISDWSSDVCSSDLDQTITLTETQENVAAVTEVLATGSIDVTGGTASIGVNTVASITVDGVDILGSAVDWTGSNSATATAVAAQINSNTSSPEYSATASGPTVIISAATGTGDGPNGFVVDGTVGGNVTLGRSEEHTSELQPLMRISYD